jgi:MFS transporter, FHS family, L-fucose permease
MHGRTSRHASANFTTAFVLTFSLFALWGLGHRLYDTLLPQYAMVFGLKGFELGLTQSVFSIVYFLGAIPAALCARRFGYKTTILFGLGSLGIGALVLYPASAQHAFHFFLIAVTVMSFGWILLEVAANPLAVSLGSAETGIRRLNLAQSFYPLGALLGAFAGRWIATTNLALPGGHSAYTAVHPYIIIGVGALLLAYLFDAVRFPSAVTERTIGLKSAASELRTLLSNRLFLFGVAAQFFGVLALTSTWSFGGSIFDAAFPEVLRFTGIAGAVWTLVVFAAGRFVGTALMYRYDPGRLLAIFAGGGILMSSIAAFSGAPLGAIAMIAGSFFVSIIWPTVLGIAIRGLGPLMKLGTALICMGSGAGGVAFMMLDASGTFPSIYLAMAIPAVSYAVVLAYAVVSDKAHRTHKATETGEEDAVLDTPAWHERHP